MPPSNLHSGIRRQIRFGDLHVDFGLAPGLIPGLNKLARRGLAAGTDAQAIKSDAESGGSVFADDRSPNREDNTKPGPTFTGWEDGYSLWSLCDHLTTQIFDALAVRSGGWGRN